MMGGRQVVLHRIDWLTWGNAQQVSNKSAIREAVSMATVRKMCDHSAPSKCRCPWKVTYRDADGVQRQKTYPHDRKTVANDFAAKAEADKIQGIRPVTSTVTFRAYAERVIRQRTGANGTKQRYLGILRNHLGSLANRKLASVADDRAGVKTLLLETLPAKGLGRAQIELCQVVIISTVVEAVREREIPSHALSGIRLPAKENGESVDPELIALLNNTMVRKIAAAMPEQQWALVIWLGRGCGLRISEATAVKLSDFNADLTILTVARQTESGTRVKELKARKPGDTRSLPVPSYVAERVREHVAQHGTHENYLFAGIRSRFVSDSSVHGAFRKAATTAGLPAEVRFHDLRHVFASHLLAASIPVPDVSRWLGHKSIQITYSVYSHFVPKSFDRAREFLDSEWSEQA